MVFDIVHVHSRTGKPALISLLLQDSSSTDSDLDLHAVDMNTAITLIGETR